MPRRRPGALLPLELEILELALALTREEHGRFHGFGLAHAMRANRGGSRALTAHGTLYKALARLEEFGLLASQWEDAAALAEGRPRRRLYELTREGAAVAEQRVRREAREPDEGRGAARSAGRPGTRLPTLGPEVA